MKLIVIWILFFGLVAFTSQDLGRRKPCNCNKYNRDGNLIASLLGKKKLENAGKSSCNICEQRKEMLRMEREKQQQLQKCPFEILGSSSLKGKTSEEIFDDFREMIIPSQNGFFDMMRGVVKTMHVSSESELKWAKEKEAKMLAEKRKSEMQERAAKIDDLVSAIAKPKTCERYATRDSNPLLTYKLPLNKESVKISNPRVSELPKETTNRTKEMTNRKRNSQELDQRHNLNELITKMNKPIVSRNIESSTSKT